MAMVESERVKMLSEGVVGKDLISEETERDGVAGALSLCERGGLSFRWKVGADSYGLITPGSTVSSEAGSVIE